MPRHRRGWSMEDRGNGRGRRSPLTISMLEPALLILIKEQPRHGYTLLSDLETLGVSALHPSVVYRTLREMEILEWVQSDWETDQTQGPPRRKYHLTAQGEEALLSWKNALEKNQELVSQLLSRIGEEKR